MNLALLQSFPKIIPSHFRKIGNDDANLKNDRDGPAIDCGED